MSDNSDELVFADDSCDSEKPLIKSFWKVLIVDDEEDVHKITKLVLSDFEFAGKKLELVSCYSGKEAAEFIKNTQDIAVILLDVVMEEDDSGLKLVKYIRTDLGNSLVRIVLRTGQPGQAPEQKVIVQYDINDYKAKTELTSEKLFTTVISSIRSYRDLQIIDRSKMGLQKIIDASANIFELQSLQQFVSGILTQFVSILRYGNDAVYCQISGFSATSEGGRAKILAGTGKFNSNLINKDVKSVLPEEVNFLISRAFTEKKNVFDENHYIGFFKSKNGSENIIYIERSEALEKWEKDMIDIFCTNVSIAFENIYLKQELENLVEKRTEQLRIVNDDLKVKNMAVEKELNMAKSVQNSIMPTLFPISDKFAVSGKYKPMYNLGGDYYDVFQIDNDRLGAVIADVSGHGLAAALITAMAKTSFTSSASKKLSTAETINVLHKSLYTSVGRSGLYITALYAIIDFSKMKMYYTSGGHNDVVLLKNNGDLIKLESTDTIIGIFPNEEYTSVELDISNGDKLVLYTDGLPEAKNENSVFLGQNKLSEMIISLGKLNCQMFTEQLFDEINSFCNNAPDEDDKTILTIEIY